MKLLFIGSYQNSTTHNKGQSASAFKRETANKIVTTLA